MMFELDCKGYFRVGKQMGGIADTLVASHSGKVLDRARALR